MNDQDTASYLAAFVAAQRQHADFLRWMRTRHELAAQRLTTQGHTEGWLPADLHFGYETTQR